jgi:DMSO/TMAO reductase YedYZ molybdopterin-dependent catalytic subunit
MNLTIVAPNGTQVVLHEDDIGRLMPYRAYGGFVNSLGIIKYLGNYTGVAISTFVSVVCGTSSAYSVSIISNDSYTVDYTNIQGFEEYNGTALVTYNNVTGQPVQHNQTLTPMLAYYYNDANLTELDGGPLRLVIVGPEGLLTPSKFWAKWVVRLEVQMILFNTGGCGRVPYID